MFRIAVIHGEERVVDIAWKAIVISETLNQQNHPGLSDYNDGS